MTTGATRKALILLCAGLRGGSVKDALAGGPYDANSAASLLDQIASGLATAHAAGVVHRDLKPSNLLLDEEGNAYLADFGIAKELGESGSRLQDDGTIIGSPDYLSPEQARGQSVTPQTDIYCLGVTLYELLVGQHPFPDLSGVQRLYKHINDPLPLIESLDPFIQPDINEVIRRATMKNPRHRYRDVLEMAAAFRQAARLGDQTRMALVEALTLREQEILQLIIQGKANREIANALFIELSTVKWYIRQIYTKLGVHNRRQAILRARDLDLLVTDDDDASAGGFVSTQLLLPSPINPYKGLRPFETPDAQNYFGRQTLIRRLLDRLTYPNGSPKKNGITPHGSTAHVHIPLSRRFLAIIGPSGSGKSSLIRAGLVPALIRGEVQGSERWFIAPMTPGLRPLDELEVCLLRIAAHQPGNLREQLERDENGLLRATDLILPRDDSELAIVIDQFEELFTLTADEDERRHFLNLLSRSAIDPRSRIRVIIGLRADYYDRPLHYPLFADMLRSNMETILPLSAEELEQAIVLPAEQVGVSCEPGLAAAIIDDVLYQPGGLPLLQFALTELFEHREGRTLTRQAYNAIGGAAGALAGRAEALYREQDAKGQEATRQIFLRLVAVGEERDILPDTRRRVLRAELAGITTEEEVTDEIIETFAAHRLLTLDHDPASRRPSVELAHEALLREWTRLREWLEASRDDLYQHRRLQGMTQEWLEEERDSGLLLTRTRLDQLAAWAAGTDLVLTPDERAFLETSIAAREDRQAQEEARRLRELEAARQLAEAEHRRAEEQTESAARLRRRAVYLSVALIAAAVLAIIALAAGRQSALNSERAAAQAAAASTAEAVANEQRFIAETERDSAAVAAQLAVAAQSTAEAESQQRAAAEAVAVQEREVAEAQTRFATTRELSMSALSSLDFDPELSILLAVEAIEITRQSEGIVLPEAETALREGLMSLRQERVIPSTPTGTCHTEIWCSDVDISPTGNLLATSGAENKAILWDASTGEQLHILDGHTAPVIAVEFSPDERRMATAGADGLVMVWELDAATPGRITAPVLLLDGHEGEVTDVTFRPDGQMIATAGLDGIIKLWNATTGEELGTLSGHERSVRDVAFSPDGETLFSAGSDQVARIWDVSTGGERLVLSGHTERLTDLAVSPDGLKIATAGWDGAIRVWDVVTGEELLSFPGDSARAYAVAFSPDGTLLAAGGTDAVITMWIAETGEKVMSLPGHGGIIYNLDFHPDRQRLASGADDGTVRVWDISRAGSREWMTLDGHDWVMFGVHFSPDGSQLATASWDGSVKLWDANSGEELETVVVDEWRKFVVEFSPDSRHLVTGAMNDSAVIWSLPDGEAQHNLGGLGGPVLDVAISPDSSLLVTVGEGAEIPGLIQIWNMQSGELVDAWEGHDGSIERAAISPDGELLATAGTDGVARLWRLDSGEPVATLRDHGAPVNGVNFSPDGRWLGTAGADNLARIWAIDGESVQLHTTLQGHSSVVWDIVFSPDNNMAATIGFDGLVKLWDVATGTERLTFPGDDNNGREVAFSPDGKLLAVTTGSGLVRLYVLPIDELLGLAEARVTRGLTDEECRQYLHVEQCPVDNR